MPLVRTDAQAGHTPAERPRIADVADEVVPEVVATPPGGRCQINTGHSAGRTVAGDSGPGWRQPNGVTSVQFVEQCRSHPQSSVLMPTRRSGPPTPSCRSARTAPRTSLPVSAGRGFAPAGADLRGGATARRGT